MNALLGGVSRFVRRKMIKDEIYDEFIRVLSREYGMVFKQLNGEHVKLCLPTIAVPDAALQDYTECHA